MVHFKGQDGEERLHQHVGPEPAVAVAGQVRKQGAAGRAGQRRVGGGRGGGGARRGQVQGRQQRRQLSADVHDGLGTALGAAGGRVVADLLLHCSQLSLIGGGTEGQANVRTVSDVSGTGWQGSYPGAHQDMMGNHIRTKHRLQGTDRLRSSGPHLHRVPHGQAAVACVAQLLLRLQPLAPQPLHCGAVVGRPEHEPHQLGGVAQVGCLAVQQEVECQLAQQQLDHLGRRSAVHRQQLRIHNQRPGSQPQQPAPARAAFV